MLWMTPWPKAALTLPAYDYAEKKNNHINNVVKDQNFNTVQDNKLFFFYGVVIGWLYPSFGQDIAKVEILFEQSQSGVEVIVLQMHIVRTTGAVHYPFVLPA